MSLIYKQAESLNKPLEVDKTLSPKGVYIRQNIQEVAYTDSEKVGKIKYTYDECFLTNSEYENYALVQSTVASTELKRESTIIDEYTLKLIEEGTL